MSLISRFFYNKRCYHGSKILLRPLYKKDITTIVSWFSNPDLLELGFGTYKNSPDFNTITTSYLKHLMSHKEQFLAIDAPEIGFIGFISHYISDTEKQVGRIGILIGKQSAWGKGFGKDAVLTALLFLFTEKGINLVELDTAVFNIRAQHCFESCGFTIDRERTQYSESINNRIWYIIDRTTFLNRQSLFRPSAVVPPIGPCQKQQDLRPARNSIFDTTPP